MHYLVMILMYVGLVSGQTEARPQWQMPIPSHPVSFLKWAKEHLWEEQKGSAEDWSFNEGCLQLISNDSSTTAGTTKDFPLTLADSSKIHMDLKVTNAPQGADLSKKSKEDAALRIFVVFDLGGGFFSPPHTIGYAFMPDAKIGSLIDSERFDTVKFIPIASDMDKLLTISRSIKEDYRKAFGREEVPPVRAIGIKADSNDTGRKSHATLCRLAID